MRATNGFEMSDSCQDCAIRSQNHFCDFDPQLLKLFEALRYTTVFPKGAILFAEGQSPHGVFLLCSGSVKLTTYSSEGKAIIARIAQAGEVLGLSASISGRPYMATAETLIPCQVNFMRRDDFLQFLKENGTACLRVSEHLSNNYHDAFEQVRSLGLSASASEKLARLILEWARTGSQSDKGIRIKLTLTHEEIGQLIGASRETVTRLLSDFKRKGIIVVKGSTLIVKDEPALAAKVSS